MEILSRLLRLRCTGPKPDFVPIERSLILPFQREIDFHVGNPGHSSRFDTKRYRARKPDQGLDAASDPGDELVATWSSRGGPPPCKAQERNPFKPQNRAEGAVSLAQTHRRCRLSSSRRLILTHKNAFWSFANRGLVQLHPRSESGDYRPRGQPSTSASLPLGQWPWQHHHPLGPSRRNPQPLLRSDQRNILIAIFGSDLLSGTEAATEATEQSKTSTQHQHGCTGIWNWVCCWRVGSENSDIVTRTASGPV